MKLSRNFTNKIHWVLDNLTPPIIRDSKIFFQPLFWILFKNKTSDFMKFKEKAPFLSDEEIKNTYEYLADVHIKRETDLNSKSEEFILNNLIGKKILDIACGRGYLVKKIAQKGDFEVTGVDFIIEDYLKNTDKIKFIEGSIYKIPFEDNYFDTVICTHTLEHIIDLQAGIKELRRVCKHNLIIIVPKQRPYKYTFDLHVHFFPYDFSLRNVMMNPKGNCINLKNDWVYIEQSYTKT